MAKALDVLGIASSISGYFDKAIKLHERGLALNEKTNNKKGIAQSLKYIGNVHLKKSDYANAIDFYTKSLNIFEAEGEDRLAASVINNIGLVYMDLNDYDKSLTQLKKALSIYKTIEANADESNTLNNIGTVYRLKKEYEDALHYYEQSLALKQENKIQYGIAICYSNIGIIHSKLQRDSLAMEYFNRGLKIHKKAGNRKGLSNSLVHIGTIYLKTNNDSSIILGKQALEIAKEIGSTEEIGKAAELLFKAYKSEGSNALALEMHELFQKIEREILSSKNQREVLRHEYQYDFDKKFHAMDLKMQKQHGNNVLARTKERYILVFTSLFAILTLTFYFRTRYMRGLRERDQLLHQIDLLKQKGSKKLISQKELELDKEKIEKVLNTKLGDSSWIILNCIYKNPSVSNKEIANVVSLSLEGVSSSLRRMYTTFGVKSSSNQKIALIMEAARISGED